jgi:hypothetical protein
MKFNKRGVLGLDLAKTVIVMLLILAVTVIAVFAALVPLEAVTQPLFATANTLTTTTTNETLATVDNVTGETVDNASLLDFVMTISPLPTCYNATNGVVLDSSNYSATAAGVITSLEGTCAVGSSYYCGYNWNCTYTYSYTTNQDTTLIVNNITSGTTSFFGFTPTWMILLAVVVLIAIIAIIIVAVSRFEGRNSTGGL